MATMSEIGSSPTSVQDDRTSGKVAEASARAATAALASARSDLPARVVSARVNLRRRLVEIWACRELLVFLIRKEVKVKYKNSVLGFAWSMLNPAFMLVVYYMVFTYFLPNGLPHFALFLFSGLLAWNLFNAALMGASGSIVNNAGIVKKVAFPREILALSQVGTACVFFCFQAVVLIAFYAGFHYPMSWSYLPLLLAAFAALIAFTAALAVFLAAVNVYLRDTQHLIEVVLAAWFWGAPIVYGFSTVYNKLNRHRLFGIPHTHLIWLYLMDPLAPIVLTFERAMYASSPAAAAAIHAFPLSWYLEVNGAVFVVSLLLLFGAMRLFSRIEVNFAEEL